MSSYSAGSYADRPLWPQIANLDCGITVSIYHHIIPCPEGDEGDVPCWTYVSSGLQQLHQPELVVTLRRRLEEAVEDWSREPLEWFKIVASWGRGGRIIDAFHTHLLESTHWLGSKHLHTVTHGMPMFLPGLPYEALPRMRLHGIVLTSKEADIAKWFGWTRVIAHYGLSTRWFPYTPWIDRDRTDCVTVEMMNGSLRGRGFDPKKIRGVSVRWNGKFLILEIPPGRELELQALVERTPERDILCLDSSLHPVADFCATWKAGQPPKELHGYGGRQSTRNNLDNFAFLGFRPEQSNDSWGCIEDGCVLLLTNATWRSIRAALTSKRNIQLQVSDDTVFSLVFPTTQFFDYFSNDNLPREPLGSGTHVVLEQVVIGNQDAITETDCRALVQLIKDILALLQDMVPFNRGNFQPNVLLVRVDLSNPDESPLTVWANTYSEGLDIQAIGNAIAHLPQPQGCTGWPVNFIALYGIWGGGVFHHQGADLESKCSSSRTLLSWAVENGHDAVVKLLLENGTEIESKDKDSWTPLSLAAASGHEAVTQLLLENGAGLESKDEHSRTLSLAIESGHEAVIKLLLEKGAELESEDEEFGRTPLSLAAASGHEAVIQLLLEKGARLESKDKSGWTPLLWALNSGHETVVQLLLEKGAQIESKDEEYGRTPLSLAAASGHEAAVQLLLEKGARLESKDRSGRTPLLWAADRGNKAVVKLLLEKGSEPESKDNLERTSLTWAAVRGYEAVVQLLLAKNNIDPNPRDRFGLTPLFLAAKNGYPNVVKLLLEKCRENGIVIRDKDINISMPQAADYPSRVDCSICVSSIPNAVIHYHCRICDNGDFDICRECIASEYLCLDHSHKLVKRVFKCGTLVEVPD